ncbi:hypothetical protein ACFQX8_25420 [Klenkia terrae]|uniref:hypothetical protein n=1 Tax=Klenkia terrae TaxID=1052259 RepID=UPI003611F2FB
MGWLITLAAALLSIPLTGDTVWARGVMDGGSEVTATQGVLVAVAGYEATVILAFAGLGAAVFFGLAAAPWSRATRWALTTVVAAVVLAGVVATLTQEQDAPSGELIGALVISLVPAALLLLLAWRRWRLTSAVIALVAVAVGVLAHAITLVRLLTSAGSPRSGPGRWAGCCWWPWAPPGGSSGRWPGSTPLGQDLPRDQPVAARAGARHRCAGSDGRAGRVAARAGDRRGGVRRRRRPAAVGVRGAAQRPDDGLQRR